MGIQTGYDLGKLIEAVAIAEDVVGHRLWGHVSKSGPRPRGDQLYPVDMPFIETLEEAAHFRNGPEVYANQISPWRSDSAFPSIRPRPYAPPKPPNSSAPMMRMWRSWWPMG